MTTIKSTAHYTERINTARARLADVVPAHQKARLAAVDDPTLIPRRDELAGEKRALEELLAGLADAHAMAKRTEDEAAAVALIDRRKEVHAAATGHIVEQVEITGEIDAAVTHLVTLFTRSESLETAWRALVGPLVPKDDKRQYERAFETLGLVKIMDHFPLKDAIEKIEAGRDGVTNGSRPPRIENARIRAESASMRIAEALGIPVP